MVLDDANRASSKQSCTVMKADLYVSYYVRKTACRTVNFIVVRQMVTFYKNQRNNRRSSSRAYWIGIGSVLDTSQQLQLQAPPSGEKFLIARAAIITTMSFDTEVQTNSLNGRQDWEKKILQGERTSAIRLSVNELNNIFSRTETVAPMLRPLPVSTVTINPLRQCYPAASTVTIVTALTDVTHEQAGIVFTQI